MNYGQLNMTWSLCSFLMFLHLFVPLVDLGVADPSQLTKQPLLPGMIMAIVRRERTSILLHLRSLSFVVSLWFIANNTIIGFAVYNSYSL